MNKRRSLLFLFFVPFFVLAVMCSSSPAADVEAILIETFPHTWAADSIGLVYDSNNDLLRYAHENATASAPYPCIFDVAYSGAHPLIRSIDLSEENAGWRSELHETNGAAFDRLANVYFLTDYNGDLTWHDDFIIEVNLQGTVLNAWGMDDEYAGSNDSSDGTAIDNIADIAVIPGNPPRYFATALYDNNKVYEISLTRGGWWVADSWHTVKVYEGENVLSEFSDNIGIDWDHENERFYHSDRYSSTVQVTDINMEPIRGISTFTCPTAGGFISGITFIEGSDPQEIWVTDYSSADSETSRFESPAGNARLVPGVPLLLLLDD